MITDKDSSICIFSDSVGAFCIDPKLLKSKSRLYVSAPNYSSQEIQNITHKIEIELSLIHEVSQEIESNEILVKTKNITKSIGIPLVNLFNPVFGGKAYENSLTNAK